MALGPFRLTCVTGQAARLIGEVELAAFALGQAKGKEQVGIEYGHLNHAREQLYEYLESVEAIDPSRYRSHKRRF